MSLSEPSLTPSPLIRPGNDPLTELLNFPSFLPALSDGKGVRECEGKGKKGRKKGGSVGERRGKAEKFSRVLISVFSGSW